MFISPTNAEVRCRLTLPPLEGTMYEPTDRSVFSSGDTVRVTCGSGHWISNPQNTSAVITCNDDGDWSVEPECQGIISHETGHITVRVCGSDHCLKLER